MKKIIPFLLILAVALTLNFSTAQTTQASTLPVLVGMYPSAEIYATVDDITAIETWLGKPTVTIAGTFIGLDSPDWFIEAELNSAWDAGYIPFVNLGLHDLESTAAQIANGDIDSHIHNWAQVYKAWSNNGEKRAMIAPLQEMNGDWVSYKLDAANFKLAYYRIFNIFQEEGVQRDWINWVFAPNGWSFSGDKFENYYPGQSVVDSVGFSSFNFGSCPKGTNYDRWETFNEIYKPYLDRMTAMAPGKALFIAEIGTVAEGGPYGSDMYRNKNTWLEDTLTSLGAYPNLRGWVYFNHFDLSDSLDEVDCPPTTDYRVHQDKFGYSYNGFKNVVTQLPYGHWNATDPEINNIMFAPTNGIFEDVWPATALSGVASAWYGDWVNRLANSGITGGCNVETIDLPGSVTDITFKYYCPDNVVTRAQMAIFLEKGMQGTTFSPPVTINNTFEDVPANYWAASWIEQLADDGITGGCSTTPLMYCPGKSVTRAQMAVFLLKAKFGASYQPPEATGIFSDVPTNYWAAKWIEGLYNEGITGGCSTTPLSYCPESPVTRAQMAVFLVKTFNLP